MIRGGRGRRGGGGSHRPPEEGGDGFVRRRDRGAEEGHGRGRTGGERGAVATGKGAGAGEDGSRQIKSSRVFVDPGLGQSSPKNFHRALCPKNSSFLVFVLQVRFGLDKIHATFISL